MAYENFTTYTEVEEITDIWSVAASKIDFTDVPLNESSYVYKDFGAGHFGDFAHLVTFYLDSNNMGLNASFCGYGQSNVITDLGSTAVLITHISAGTGVYWLYCRSRNGGLVSSDPFALSLDTPYYLTVSRNGTTYQVLIYDDVGRTNLLDTIAVVCATTTFQYNMAASSWDAGANASRHITGYIENLDLQEWKAPNIITFDANSARVFTYKANSAKTYVKEAKSAKTYTFSVDEG